MGLILTWGKRWRGEGGTMLLALGLVFLCVGAGAQSKPGDAGQSRATSSGSAAKRPTRAADKTTSRGSTDASARAQLELERLAHDLHETPTPGTYEQLSQFAGERSNTVLGARAALALGYYDYTQAKYPEARQWLEKAVADPLLGDYALYWEGLTDRASGATGVAVDELRTYRKLYPNSVMSDLAVENLAEAALSADRPEDALAALTGYPKTTAKAGLVLLQAQAREKAALASNELPFAAAADYLDLVYRFPLSDEAKIGAGRIPYLRLTLGEQFPGIPLETEIARAEALYDARRWADMRSSYQDLLPKVSGSMRERATLRIAQADVQSGGSQEALASLTLSDPDVDAERIYVLSQFARAAKDETAMFGAVEKLATAYPQSPWTEEALFAAGNYEWVNLDRDRAVEYYLRAVAAFPEGRYAALCQWRVVWTAYLDRQPDVAGRLEEFLRRYPTSANAVDALYWLGRTNERANDLERARGFYLAAVLRYPQTYFADRAGERLRAIGPAPSVSSEVIALIPPAAPLPSWTAPLPEAAMVRWTRATALECIDFENSAELELRAAYAETHAPKLLLAAAEAAVESRRYAAGMQATRQLVPELEARRYDEVPDEAWRTAYPMPYSASLESEALRNHLDPMLVAGLIRQESAFAADAVSRANAVGLMQVEPKTGLLLARHLRVKFSRARLFDPEYNLRLGTSYLAGLVATYGTPEAALAAYNAGEDRVAQWTTGQNFTETPEFVESIPFTETREYVQIVLRNAELYRQIYNHLAAVSSVPPQAARPAGDAVTTE